MARYGSWYSDWCFDSGASCHMRHQIGKFENVSNTEGKEIFLADRGLVMAEGVGTVKLQFLREDGRSMNVTISDVLFVPEIDENLISISKLTEKGFDVLLSGRDCFLVKGGHKILVAKYSNCLFRLLNQLPEHAKSAVEERAQCIHQCHRKLVRHLNDGKTRISN